MTAAFFDRTAHVLGDRLVDASLEGAVVIAIVWVACRLVPRTPAWLQAALWWIAALKLVIGLLPLPAVRLAVLPPVLPSVGTHLEHQMRDDSPIVGKEVDRARGGRSVAATGADRIATPPSRPDRTDAWVEAAIGLWMLVVAAHAIRVARGLYRMRGIVRRSRPCTDEDAATVARLSATAGLRRAPVVRTSTEIETPQVAGLRQPIVLVPSVASGPYVRLASDERKMALCHELAHVRRRDLAFGWIPALAERLFFFHPLARLAAREYLTAREAACDAAVLHSLAVSPQEYGRFLARLGIARPIALIAAGGSSASTSSLYRRLAMLQHVTSTRVSRTLGMLTLGVVTLLLVPVRLVAQQAPVAPSSPAAPVATTPARPVVRAAQVASPAPVAPAVTAPARPVVRAAPVTREAPATPSAVRPVTPLRVTPAVRPSQQQDARQGTAQPDAGDTADDAVRKTTEAMHELMREVQSRFREQEVAQHLQTLAAEIEATQRLMRQGTLQAERAARETEASAVATLLRGMQEQQAALAAQMEAISRQHQALAATYRELVREAERLQESLRERPVR